MTTDARQITVAGVQVAVVRKPIKNLHLAVYPPNGRVRIAAPLVMRDDAIRVAVIRKLGWIRRQQAALGRQERQSAREMVSGEAHFYLGRRYRLNVATDGAPGNVSIQRSGIMTLHIRPEWDRDRREDALYEWYRERLREVASPLVAKWSRRLRVDVRFLGLKRMKTKWGSCNAAARRVWLNVELAKKPAECVEYLVVHELAHLIRRRHDDRFQRLLDRHLPRWRHAREVLNRAPLANERWKY